MRAEDYVAGGGGTRSCVADGEVEGWVRVEEFDGLLEGGEG